MGKAKHAHHFTPQCMDRMVGTALARLCPPYGTVYAATNSATPITISTMPETSRGDIGCLNE